MISEHLQRIVSQSATWLGSPELGAKVGAFVDAHRDQAEAIGARIEGGDRAAIFALARGAGLTALEETRFVEATITFAFARQGELDRSLFESGARANAMGRDGATVGPYVAKHLIDVKKSKAELAADVAGLNAAWPKDAPAGADPVEFVLKASDLDRYQKQRLAALGPRPPAALVSELIDEANIIHAKAGHRENVLGAIGAFLGDEKTRGALTDAAALPGGVRELDRLLREAASLLNLADVSIPTRFLSAKRKLTPEESDLFIKPRTEQSAALARVLGLADEATIRMIEEVRPSSARERTAPPQILQLLDDLAALAAKPFFQIDGKVVAERTINALSENAQRTGARMDLVEILADGIRRGLADQALTRTRDENLYLRQ